MAVSEPSADIMLNAGARRDFCPHRQSFNVQLCEECEKQPKTQAIVTNIDRENKIVTFEPITKK